MVPAFERWTAASRPAAALEAGALAAAALLGVLCGGAVAVAGLNALYLCAGLIACAFILLDFRIGVVLLILLMPISTSYLFPHEMFGIKGLNPLNLLLVGTFGSYLIGAMSDGSLRRFLPRPLLWLYVLPIVIAGVLGSHHVGDIAPGFFIYDALDFQGTAGYVIDVVAKPMVLVVYALLIGAAVSKSDKPEGFLLPAWISMWVMGAIVIVYIARSGIGLQQLASSHEREFLSVLGLHADDLGRLYAVGYALLLFTWAEAKAPGARLGLLASMGFVVFALMLTFSRGAFLAFTLVNVLFLLWRRNWHALLFFALLAAVALFALPDAVYERVTMGFGSGLNAVSAGRIDGLWLPLLPELLRHPVFGNGLESILWSEPMRRGPGVLIIPVTHPHNAYLEALLDMGIVGLALLGSYFAGIWKGFRALAADSSLSPTLRGFYLGAVAGLLGLLVAYLTDSSLRPRPDQTFLWFAVGMLYGRCRR
ncbi:MAG: O-antigen ligase family protein [Burkholderiales bacterium]